MNMKSITASALIVVGAMLITCCSTDTIWEEASCAQETLNYSNGELPAMVTVYKDRAEVKLYKDLTHYIYLDGVLIKEVKQHSNEQKVVLRALTPNTEYHLFITALEGEKVLTKEQTFTTHPSYVSVIGWLEMNYYDGEEELGFVRQMPGGDFLDYTHRYYYYSDDDFCLRLTDADGMVKWRSYIPVTDASVSEESHIAAWSSTNNTVWSVHPETGAALYHFDLNLKDGYINGACACSDGGMAIVGRFNNASGYYFARLDAHGQLVHESLQAGDGTSAKEEDALLADELYEIHEAADGHIVAMGRKGEHTFVAIAFDASGNVVGTSSDYAENRDLEYRVYFKQSVRDNGGNIYFLGGAEVNGNRGYGAATVIIKVDAHGEIQWVRTLSDDYDEFYSTAMHLISDNTLCVLHSGKSTRLAFMTTENELLQDVSFKANYNAVWAWPVNEEHTLFCCYDKYGRVLYIDTKGE